MRIIVYTLLLIVIIISCNENNDYIKENIKSNDINTALSEEMMIINRDTGLYVKEIVAVGESNPNYWSLKVFQHNGTIRRAVSLVMNNDTSYSNSYYYLDGKPFGFMQEIVFQGKTIGDMYFIYNENEITEMRGKGISPDNSKLIEKELPMIHEQALKIIDNYSDFKSNKSVEFSPLYYLSK